VDATFREEQKRQAFSRAAVQWGVPSGILLCQAEPETVRKRLENRQGDASDADWPVYLQLAANWEKVGPLAGQVLHVISTGGGPEQALGRALEALRQSGLHG
jgi:hypothetical protein